MENLGRLDEGIMLPDGGYFGTLGVFHDLHCLVRVKVRMSSCRGKENKCCQSNTYQRRVHHVLYRDHYFPDLTDEQRHLDDRHAAHCLNSLRQSIQCAGDVSLLTMKWVPYNREPTANFTGPHQCVNWDGIQDWAHDRVYDVMAPNVLVHPVLGPSYPDGGHSFGVARVGKVGTDSKLTT